MAFTYYPVGGLTTDPSKNCFTMNLPSEPSDIEIKQSSRPASSAMRQIYQKDSYKTSISTAKRNGKDYITNIPLISETSCASVDCSGSATTYYKLDSGSYDSAGKYTYQVLSSNVDDVVESGACVPGTAPSGYGAQPTECSQTCFPTAGGPARSVTETVSGTSCVMSNCHETEQITDCSESTTYYKLDSGSYDSAGKYTYQVLSSNVDDVVESGACVPGTAPSGYGAQPTECSQTCFPTAGGPARSVTGTVSGTSCVISNCYENRHCGSNTVYSRDSGTYDGEGNYVYNVISSNIPRVDNGSGCVNGSIPSGYTETQPTCSQTCFPDNGTGQREVTGVLNAQSQCVFTNCYEEQQPCGYTTYTTQAVDPNSFQKKTAWALRTHDGTKSVPIETIEVANLINANGECLPPTNIPAGAIDASTACSVTAQQQVCAESRSNNVAVAATGTITKNADGTSSCTLENCYDYDPWWRCDIDKCDKEMGYYIDRIPRWAFNSTGLAGCDNCPYRKYGENGQMPLCGKEENHRSGFPTAADWDSAGMNEHCYKFKDELYLHKITSGNWNNEPVFYRPGMKEEAEALPSLP